MGMKADQEISLDFEGLLSYLRSKTRVFMDVDGHEYYVTHTDGYWRVQDCERLNDKVRFVDCSELVTTLPELAIQTAVGIAVAGVLVVILTKSGAGAKLQRMAGGAGKEAKAA